MVVKGMKWRPWPPLYSKKYDATIRVRCIKGLLQPIAGVRRSGGEGELSSPSLEGGGLTKLTVEVRWKGPKGGINGFKPFAFSRSVKRNYTREEELVLESGIIQWDEEFRCNCRFSGEKDGLKFYPWEVQFSIFNASHHQNNSRVMIAGPAVLNLADFVSYDDEKDLEIDIPLTLSSGDIVFTSTSLSLSIHLSELKVNKERPEAVGRSSSMPLPSSLSPCFRSPLANLNDKQSTSSRKSLKKVKSLTDYVSSRMKLKKVHGQEVASSDSKFSTGSDDSECIYPFDTDSFDFSDDGASLENKEESANIVQESLQYGTLVSANLARGVFDSIKNCEDDEGLVYYGYSKPDYGGDLAAEVPDQSVKLSPKLGMLWRKRKLSFRSHKARGEPLLKKEYDETGGDDIDFVRRHLTSDSMSPQWSSKTEDELLSLSQFGDDKFSVGSWECKEIVSRDGSKKLQTQVFFASIDQRHEKVAGESACTALVVVIADWLHSNRATMLTKSEFDGLIREGSLQWRNLCGVEVLMARFPDKHFDLDTVLQAGIRPVAEVSTKSFIGFFHVEGMEEEERFEFLHGVRSFDSIWDEISCIATQLIRKEDDSLVYIVSWNDHFFVLKVDVDAYYIIDTLGERLFEGCKQAFMLRFDEDSVIEKIPRQNSKENKKTVPSSSSPSSSPSSPSLEKVGSGAVEGAESGKLEVLSGRCNGLADWNDEGKVEDGTVVCRGKEACKEYIKSFLAAVPIRELQADVKKGLTGSSVSLHQRLQIELHHTDQILPLATNATASSVAEGSVVLCDGSSLALS